ncbi:MAG TPA: Holliday junction branch migration protein RuvA [Clostridiales bacterium]|nr:Holliday junction branch migration protein RuvA [Clostridiales bacterium]
MISYLRGELIEKKEKYIIIDVNNIGYEIALSTSAIMGLPSIGGTIKIYTHLHVREDVIALFGFITKDDLEMFKLLITVNGIGPKGALGILSGLSADEIRFAVLAEDISTITKAPGVGKKTASKLILELKDKFELNDVFEQSISNTQNNNKIMEIKDEAIQALLALGYSSSDAMRAIKQIEVDDNMTVDELLKQCLKKF